MQISPILILGGAGKTGRRVAAGLGARGVDFRLVSRSSEPRLDWYDESTWASAVRGGTTAYLAPPVDPDGLAAAGRFVRRAAANGLRRLVLLSGRGVGSPGREFAVYDSQLELEDAVKVSGLEWTILQPAWFMQNFSEAWLRDYVLGGQLRLSAGDGGEAWVDTDDVGDVAVEVLLDDRHVGRTYALSGPRLRTLAEVAADLTEATGRPVEYVRLDPDEHAAEMIDVGVPRADAEALRDLFAVVRNHRSEYLSDGIDEVLGRRPKDFAEWAVATAAAGAWSDSAVEQVGA
ncbi:NAD(P)H-binding protein [Pseudonocardia sp. TRM90224]|uniref:NAD(P)H-binding protein n=1 Tax=Pseudonocardia sp. TRM90224 TaxID=2812678 RepID=UPI001E4D9D25|nr:NAD(P)H-binding protein [Pseudonocardia sp. TRM90224]